VPLDATGFIHLFGSYGSGYLGLAALLLLAAAGVPLPVPITATLIVLGALTARPDGPSFLALAVVATPAATAGHCLDYWLGRSSSPVLQRWRKRLERRFRRGALLSRLEEGFVRNAGLVILGTRCLLTPLASPVSLLAGAARIAFPVYLVLELAGTSLYVCGNLTLGWLLGPTLARAPFTLAIFYGLLALLIALPSLLRQLRRLRPAMLRQG
jgi:membrane protein DedA with SNARE-associated domain